MLIDPFKADVFSFGFVLYECVTFRREPLCRLEAEEAFDELVMIPIKLRPGEMDSKSSQVPEDVFDLVEKCFEDTPEARPDFEEIVTVLEDVLHARVSTAFNAVQSPSDGRILKHDDSICISCC